MYLRHLLEKLKAYFGNVLSLNKNVAHIPSMTPLMALEVCLVELICIGTSSQWYSKLISRATLEEKGIQEQWC